LVYQVVQPKGTNVSAVIKWINAVIKRDRRSGYGRTLV
jgi:hypothetical protein